MRLILVGLQYDLWARFTKFPALIYSITWLAGDLVVQVLDCKPKDLGL